MRETPRNAGASTSMMALVALVLLVLVGFLLMRGFSHRSGGDGQGAKSDIQIHIPAPTAPGK